VKAGSHAGLRLMAGKLKSKAVKLVFGVALLGIASCPFNYKRCYPKVSSIVNGRNL